MNHSFEQLLGILGSVFHAHSACLFIKDTSGNKLLLEGARCQLVSSFSLNDTILHDACINEGKGLIGWILRHNQPLLVSNFDQRHNFLGYYQEQTEQHIKAFMGCPLTNGLGVLCVDSKRQYSFAENDQKLLHLFARLLSTLYEELHSSQRLHSTAGYFAALQVLSELRHSHTKWAEFLQAFLQLLVTATPFTYAAFFVPDVCGEKYLLEGESTPTLQVKNNQGSYPMAGGIVGWVFRHGLPILNSGDDLSTESALVPRAEQNQSFQTAIALPLIFQRKTRGVLCLASKAPFALTPALKDFALMANEYLALFLENLMMKNRLKKNHQELHILKNS